MCVIEIVVLNHEVTTGITPWFNYLFLYITCDIYYISWALKVAECSSFQHLLCQAKVKIVPKAQQILRGNDTLPSVNGGDITTAHRYTPEIPDPTPS